MTDLPDAVKAERLIGDLVSMSEDSAEMLLCICQSLDNGEQISVSDMPCVRTRKKLRHLFRALGLRQEQDFDRIINFCKPQELDTSLAGFVMTVYDGSGVKYRPVDEKLEENYDLVSSDEEAGPWPMELPADQAKFENDQKRAQWMTSAPKGLAAIFGDKTVELDERRMEFTQPGRDEQRKKRKRFQEMRRTMDDFDRNRKPLLELHQTGEMKASNVTSGLPKELRGDGWGKRARVRSGGAQGNKSSAKAPWRSFDPEADMNQSRSISKDEFAKLLSQSQKMKKRFGEGTFDL